MIDSIDLTLYNFLINLHSPAINWLWIFLAQYGIYAIVLIAVFVILKKETREKILLILQSLLVLVLARGIVSETITFFFDRQRPFQAGYESLYAHGQGESFPSGHTTSMFAIAFVLYGWDKKAGKYALAIATLSGISRVTVGVHWISDVVGGFLIAWIVYVLLKKLIFSEKKEEIPEESKITQ